MAWQFWIDRGGTFTDVIGVGPGRQMVCRKYLSDHPERYADAAVFGIRDILGIAAGAPFPRERVSAIKIGTTVATNALLERRGAPTVLAITAGFADALKIGTQHRPRLFDLRIDLPAPLYGEVVEIRERLSATGDIVTPIDEAASAHALRAAFGKGFRAVAVVLVHGYRFPAHERRLATLARDIGFTQISVSHAVNPMIKLVPRGDTTVCDAYLSPVLDRYVASVTSAVGATPLAFMQSNGGLADALRIRGKDAVLSGPAGGVVGFAETSRALGFERVIGFDMGGTSTDVSLFDGTYERTFDSVVAGVRLRAPMMKIHTVAAGGGSICSFDGLRLKVGPESAGANPGPACYRRGGPITVTDCNVLLGRIRPERFPRVFGRASDQPIDVDVVRQKISALAVQVSQSTRQTWTAEALADGFIRIATDNVVRAIRKISVEAGHDVRDYALACFGGAGGQLATRVADTLGISTIILHPLAGVLSAFGIGLARPRAIKEKTLGIALGTGADMGLDSEFVELESLARADVGADATIERRVHLRGRGLDTVLAVPFAAVPDMMTAYAETHRRRFGFAPTPGDLICETIELEATAIGESLPAAPTADAASAPSETRVDLYGAGGWQSARCIDRHALSTDTPLQGPAVIAEALATTVIDPGWRADLAAEGSLILRRGAHADESERTTARDPVTLELFNNIFMSIAEQMGAILQNTARSVNIKERLDFSCAVFDGEGRLIANAPHMPVHLGSMGDSVRAVRAARSAEISPGSAFAINAPYGGGTHLPDITVVSPVFVASEREPRFFVASRGHHADIGGITPGSMPPDSRTIDQEGVLFESVQIVRGEEFLVDDVSRVLTSGSYPARDSATNIADLKAQCAANTAGANELLRISDRYGADVVTAYMGHVQDYAEEAVRRAIVKLSSGAYSCAMDNGAAIKVSIGIDHARRAAVVDFAGTSPQTADNFNAPSSVCRAAVLYAFRTLVNEDIPLNDGCLRPIDLRIPAGSILDPRPPAAVVAGNVETSQIICDALYGALGAVAAAQGTMNNFTVGTEAFQYYETIAGGAGAGPSFDGASAVQTHMTNSRLTDPEILETRFPVRIEEFAIRRGSGGHGAHSGGDGVRRTFRFLAPMSASILSGRRATRPFGLAGGADAAPGRTTFQPETGESRVLKATDRVDVGPGDRISIETPGGGGFGAESGRQ
ncbi:MAG: 5-oxoprolinase [Alphaproteobacteria bacterium]|nr:5-oxoprolinase [Alphaproteobacteria bacterium]